MQIQDMSQFKVAAFFERTPDLVCIAGKDGFFRKVNKAVIDKLEYTKTELFSLPISSFVFLEDRERTSQEREAMLNGKPLLNFQNRYVTRTGKIIWLQWTSVYFEEEEVVFAIAKDITETKQLETEAEERYRKFKNLAAHFKKRIEEDRKSFANELHEDLAQLAAALKTEVDWIGNNIPELSPASGNRIGHALSIAETLISTIQRIAFSVSPVMLEDIGLEATLEWYCREFSIVSGIPCQFKCHVDEEALTHEIKTDFFRVCQESLSNVITHAAARNVKINITDAGDTVHLVIEDDGDGFLMHDQTQTPGLIRMRERIASINGQLIIQSRPAEGTKILVIVPKPQP